MCGPREDEGFFPHLYNGTPPRLGSSDIDSWKIVPRVGDAWDLESIPEARGWLIRDAASTAPMIFQPGHLVLSHVLACSLRFALAKDREGVGEDRAWRTAENRCIDMMVGAQSNVNVCAVLCKHTSNSALAESKTRKSTQKA